MNASLVALPSSPAVDELRCSACRACGELRTAPTSRYEVTGVASAIASGVA